jgi:uncharacterized protein
MGPYRYWFPRLLLSLLALGLLPPVSVGAQQLPRSVTIGANPPGTVFYALASGIAKVASEGAPFHIVVQPYTGTSTFLPLVNNGELDFGLIGAADLVLAYQGSHQLKIGGHNPFPHTPNVRLVMRGSPLMGGLLVRKDSPIKSIHEIKGKRVTGEYRAHLAMWTIMFAHLVSADLTWDDVKVVPVPAVNEGIDALVQGRAEVSGGALGAAKIREADAAVGVRHVSLDCSAQGEERLRKQVPAYYPRWVKSGHVVAIVEDTCVSAYDTYLLTHKAATQQPVTTVLKAVWDNAEKLPPLHAQFKEWTRERAVAPDVTIPYHPAAIQFYRERGIWSAKMDEAQRRLLALNP